MKLSILKISLYTMMAFGLQGTVFAMEQATPLYPLEQGVTALFDVLKTEYTQTALVKTLNGKTLLSQLNKKLADKYKALTHAELYANAMASFTAEPASNHFSQLRITIPDTQSIVFEDAHKGKKTAKAPAPSGKIFADKKNGAEKANSAHSNDFAPANAAPVAPGAAASSDEQEKYQEELRVYAARNAKHMPAAGVAGSNQKQAAKAKTPPQPRSTQKTQQLVKELFPSSAQQIVDAALKLFGEPTYAKKTVRELKKNELIPAIRVIKLAMDKEVVAEINLKFAQDFAIADSAHKEIDEAGIEAELERRAIEFERRKALEKGLNVFRKNKNRNKYHAEDLARAVTFAGKKHRERWSTAGKTDQQIKRKWFNIMMEKAQLSPFNQENVTQAAASAQPADFSPAFASAIAAQSHSDQNSDEAAFAKRMDEYRQRQLEKLQYRSRPTAFAAQAGAASAYDHTLDQPATGISFQLPASNLQPAISASESAEAVKVAAHFEQSLYDDSIVAAQLHEQILKEESDAKLAAQLNDEQVAQQMQTQWDDEVHAQAPQQRFAAAANPQAAMAKAAAKKPTATAPRAKTVAKPAAAAHASHASKPAPKRVATPKTAALKAPTASRATVAKKVAPQTAAAAKPAARKADGKAAERANHKTEVDEQPSAIKIEMLSDLAEVLPHLLHHFLLVTDEKPYIALLRPAVEKNQNVLKAESLTDATNLLNAIKDRAHLLSDKDLTVVFEAVVESYKILEKENEEYYGGFNG